MININQDEALTRVKMTIVFDNQPAVSGVKASWGFACVVNGAEKTILFDTGADGPILLDNMKKLDAGPDGIHTVVISHQDWDHAGGLEMFLQENPAVTVYLLPSFAAVLKAGTSETAKVVEVPQPQRICPGVYTTGELKAHKNEQALVLSTEKGLVVLTGCAHPGIENILQMVWETFGVNIYMVLGGFHLGDKTDAELDAITARFQQLGIEYVGPTHCTGEKAKTRFKTAYGDKYLQLGVGRILQVV